jgi:hypothetical protein
MKPDTLCLAPWVHTYLSPQTERRMCCASREPAQNFMQYIDTAAGTGEYIPITLEQHWNSEHMRSVRRRMMAGETLPECDVCNNKILNTDVYRDYFWHLFRHKYDQAMASTQPDGTTSMTPVSWDYRFSNLCNFKCRMCGDMLSSSWESEERQHNMINWANPKNNWMRPDIRSKITEFQDTQIEQEFSRAVEAHEVEEVYWVGGEPLMYEQHWRYMKRIVELGDGPRIYARYNTNLSRVAYQGTDLYHDILAHIKDWQICASLDGTGATGEYIRTGLNYSQWLDNFRRGVEVQQHGRQMRIDFTLTLPGLLEVRNIMRLADEFGVGVLAKVMFGFGPEIIMSPLSLPRSILNGVVDDLVADIPPGAMRDILMQLKNRPTFQEEWPDRWQEGLRQGKRRVLQLEKLRNDKFTLEHILSQHKGIYDWWTQID